MSQTFIGPGSERFGSGSPFSFDGAVDYRSKRSRFVATIRAPGINAKCTYVSERDDIYVSVHPSRRTKIGAAWLRTDSKGMLGNQNFQIRPDQLYTRGSPHLFDKLEKKGTKVVRGVPTTHYSGSVGIGELSAGARDNPALKQFGQTVPVGAYIDADNHLRRLTFKIAAARGFGLVMVMDFFDYGEPIEIETPSGSLVKDGAPQLTATACFPEVPPPGK
jgi:hypothetical protein